MAILSDMDDPSERVIFHSELSADWEDSVEVTDHAVPEGEPASSHKEKKPRTYSLRVVLTDTPLEGQDYQAAPQGARFDAIMERWLTRHLLGRLRYYSESTGVVEQLHITSVRRGRTNVGRTIYDIQFKQVRQARAATVRLAPPKRHRKPTTTPEVDVGPAPAPEAPVELQSANHRVWVQGGPVNSYQDSLKFRLLNTDWAVGEQTQRPDVAAMQGSFLPAGPKPPPPPAELLYTPSP